jgi:hypothetical protein
MGLCRIGQGQFDAAKFHHHCVLKTGGGDARLGRHVVVFARVAADPRRPRSLHRSSPARRPAKRRSPIQHHGNALEEHGIALGALGQHRVSASMARAPLALARAMSSRAKLAPSSRESDRMAALVQHDHGQWLEALRAGMASAPARIA